MAYVLLCKALYDYTANAEDELSFAEDALLYVVEAGDPEWWKAKLKTDSAAEADVDEEDDGPVGLIPANYVEEAEPLRVSRALYDYAKQNDDELDMAEDELISVYEVKGEWLLVKRQEGGAVTGQLGFVPANYVDEVAAVDGVAEPMEAHEDIEPETPRLPVAAAAPAPKAAKDDAIKMWAVAELDAKKKKKKGTLGIGNSSLFFASESDKAPVQKVSVMSVIGHTIENKGRQINLQLDDIASASVKTDDMHTIRFVLDKKGEADEVWAKIEESKFKTERANTEAQQEQETTATAADYEASAEDSESPQYAPQVPAPPPAPAPPPLPNSARSPPPAAMLPPPTRSAAILPPPTRSAMPKAAVPEQEEPEPEHASQLAAPNGTSGGEQAIALYDFDAQGDDELTVAENEQLILVDRETDDWWKVRNAAGQEGVVPASYVEVSEGASNGAAVHGSARDANGEADGASALAIQQQVEEEERRRQEEEAEAAERERLQAERQAKAEAQARAREAEDRRRQALKTQPAPAPPRAPPVAATANASASSRDVSIPSNRSAPARPKEAPSKSKPSPARTRMWTDRTAQFKVEAEFLGFNHGKIRLHKLNGVVIEVAVEKMSNNDIAYLEEITGRRLMPASRSSRSAATPSGEMRSRSDREMERRREAEREQRRRRDQGRGPRRNIDWFEFFLAAGVDMDECTRYASAFERDKIDEAVLPDMDAGILRSIGLREGDIIRVLKFIQKRHPSSSSRSQSSADMSGQIKSDEALARKLQEQEQSARRNGTTPPPNLFSGPDGSLKNNTRRGRPTPQNRSANGVDPASLAAVSESLTGKASPTKSQPSSPEVAKVETDSRSLAGGFDDDAWTPRPSSSKPSASETPPPQPPRPPAAVAPPPKAPSPPPVPAPPPAPAVALPAPSTPTATEPAKPPADPNSALFDKLAAMKPPSSGSSPAMTRPGASPMGSNGLYNGPRGPYAPVAQNTQMLQPLISTQGTGQFMPTGLGHQPTGMGFMQPQQTGYTMYPQQTGFMQPQQTGFMQPQQTGYGGFGGMSGQQSPFGMQTQPTGFISNQMTGMPGQQPIDPQQTAQQFNNQQQQRQNDETNSGPERFSAANVFGQMKQGNMHKDADAAPQNAQKYDALRPQPTGFQPGGYLGQQYTGFGGGYGQY